MNDMPLMTEWLKAKEPFRQPPRLNVGEHWRAASAEHQPVDGREWIEPISAGVAASRSAHRVGVAAKYTKEGAARETSKISTGGLSTGGSIFRPAGLP